ncbi:hypothetical protein AAMO2058_000378600 [Amorphochlora amoebiformis]
MADSDRRILPRDAFDRLSFKSDEQEKSGNFEELMRIHQLWGDTKTALRESHREKQSLVRNYKTIVEGLENRHKRKISDLRDEIAMLKMDNHKGHQLVATVQSEAARVRAENEDLRRQLIVARQRVRTQGETLMNHDTRISNTIKRAEEQDLRSTILNLQRKLSQNQRVGHDAFQSEIVGLKEQVKVLEDEKRELKTKLNSISEAHQVILEENLKQKKMLSESRSGTEEIQTKLKESRQEMALKYLNNYTKTSDSRQEEMRNHLNHVAKRMTSPSPRHKKTTNTPTKRNNKTRNTPTKRTNKTKSDNDMPPEVLALVKEFSESYQPNRENSESGYPSLVLGAEKIKFRELLVKLNLVWHSRMQSRVTKLSKRHQADLRRLKRTFLQKVPYKSVLQRAHIQRLKIQITKHKNLLAKTRMEPPGLLNLALASLESLTAELSSKTAQTRRLRSMVAQLRHAQDNTRVESAFLAGVKWAGDKAVLAIRKMTSERSRIVSAHFQLARDGFAIDKVEAKLQSDLNNQVKEVLYIIKCSVDNSIGALPIHLILPTSGTLDVDKVAPVEQVTKTNEEKDNPQGCEKLEGL